MAILKHFDKPLQPNKVPGFIVRSPWHSLLYLCKNRSESFGFDVFSKTLCIRSTLYPDPSACSDPDLYEYGGRSCLDRTTRYDDSSVTSARPFLICRTPTTADDERETPVVIWISWIWMSRMSWGLTSVFFRPSWCGPTDP